MNLLGSNGNKTTNLYNIMKEKLLKEEIRSLRNLHQQSCSIFDKVVLLLKKILTYEIQHQDLEQNQLDIKKNLIGDIWNLQAILVNMRNMLFYDRQLFQSSIVFRDSEKNLQGTFFKKMLKSYENFKEFLNKVIHRLQQDIQKLETNGYHIYTNVIKPNNVLGGVKKVNLERYLNSLKQIQLIRQKMKKRMSLPEDQSIKKQLKIANKNNFVKTHLCMKMLRQTFLKENLHRDLMIQEVCNIKSKLSKQSTAIKMVQSAITKNKQILQHLNIEMRIFSEDAYLQKNQLKIYCKSLKEKMQQYYIPNPIFSENSKSRSKSCHTIIMRHSPVQLNKKKVEESKQVVIFEVIGSDFLQKLIQV